MITAKLFKMQESGRKCDGKDCSHNLQYHDHIIGKNWFIKQDSTCVVISFWGADGSCTSEIYCRECIDIVYKKLKPILDSKLWVMG